MNYFEKINKNKTEEVIYLIARPHIWGLFGEDALPGLHSFSSSRAVGVGLETQGLY